MSHIKLTYEIKLIIFLLIYLHKKMYNLRTCAIVGINMEFEVRISFRRP